MLVVDLKTTRATVEYWTREEGGPEIVDDRLLPWTHSDDALLQAAMYGQLIQDTLFGSEFSGIPVQVGVLVVR